VRCHLGVAPQERTAEEHNTRGPHTTLATFGRETSAGTVSRGWSLWTVQCEGGTYLARTLTTSGLPKRSSTSCWLEWMAADAFNCLYFIAPHATRSWPLTAVSPHEATYAAEIGPKATYSWPRAE